MLITQLVFWSHVIALRSYFYHAAKYSRCSVYAASAWKTKIRGAYDEWWRCCHPADPLPLNILTLFVWIPLFGLVRSHHVVVSSLLLLMEKILSKILPLGYSRKFFVSDQFFDFRRFFFRFFRRFDSFSLIRFLINSKSNKCKLWVVLQKMILRWIQRKNEFFGNRFWDRYFFAVEVKMAVLVKNNGFSQEIAYFIRRKSIFKLSKFHVCFKKGVFGHKLAIFWQFSWLGWEPKKDILTFSRKFQVSGNSPNFYTVWLSYSRSKGHTASHFSVDSTRFNTF